MTRLNGSIPFYMFNQLNKDFKKYDKERCNGDCLEYLQKYLNIEFSLIDLIGEKSRKNFKPRLCTVEDIGRIYFNPETLYICPPKQGLIMKESEMNRTRENWTFIIKPVNHEK